MARTRSIFVCTECGHESARWSGQCGACKAWNSMVEEIPRNVAATFQAVPGLAGRTEPALPVALSEIVCTEDNRIQTGLSEIDRVLGGGIVRGSAVLVAGDPGIGKSTLMTMLGASMPDRVILYIAGEESPAQIKMRASRLGVDGERVLLLSETNVEAIARAVHDVEPAVLIVDSVQTLFRPDLQSAPGSVGQVRESASSLIQMAKFSDIAVFLVGHVTKDGGIAGPRVLEHMVDTVLHLEGDRHHAFRILRAVKNRFGSTNEIGIFEMRGSGLHPVEKPGKIFLSDRDENTTGAVVVCAIEGTRPLLAEIQALVTPSSYSVPQRTATGIDSRRLQMLLAVLEKHVGMKFSSTDVFLNVTGGLRLVEPSLDLGIVAALASSLRNRPVDRRSVFIGEVGLGGEVRPVPQLETRLREAARLGFTRALVPSPGIGGLNPPSGMMPTPVESLVNLLDLLL